MTGGSDWRDLKILIVGKRASVTGWLEDCAAAWRAEGHEVGVAATRDPRLHASIEALLLDRRFGAPLASVIARQARRFSPDIIVAIGAYHIPAPVLDHLVGLPGRPPIVGWVGDLFAKGAGPAARRLDAVAYTDSGLVALHQGLAFETTAFYLPHAVNPHPARPASPPPVRENRLVFVANPTDHRRRVVAQIADPISIYGPGWTPVPGVDHQIVGRRVARGNLPAIYGRHLAALNIRNEHNVLAGLNQRSFDPYLAETPVVSDDQKDLALCFEVGREVLVYRDVAGLNDIHARLRRDPGQAAEIGRRGRERVLAEHTYARRLERLIQRV